MTQASDQIEPLLVPLTRAQQILVRLITDPFVNKGRSVVFQYVDINMKRHSLDAAEVISTLPYIQGTPDRPYRYSAIQTDSRGALQSDTKLQPTVLGLHHTENTNAVEMFFRSINGFRTMYIQAFADPHVASPIFLSDRALDPYITVNCKAFQFLLEPLASHEPLSQGCHRMTLEDSSTGWDISRLATTFSSNLNIENYLQSTRMHIAPAPSEPVFVAPSPFDLVASLDYLNAVWRLAFAQSLVTIHSAERISRLTFDVASGDELASRLSGLIEIYKALNVPGTSGHGGDPVQRLAPFVISECPTVDANRIQNAVDTLSAATHLRNGLLHSQPGRHFVPALAKFGLSFPILDHRTSWQAISQKTVQALTVIREEIQAAKP